MKVPELRRVPAIVIMKVKKEIGCFLEEIETDGARYYCTDKSRFHCDAPAGCSAGPTSSWIK